MLKEMEESDSEDATKKSNLRVLEVMAEDCGDLAANFAIPAMPAVIVFADGEVRMFSISVFWYRSTDLAAGMVDNLIMKRCKTFPVFSDKQLHVCR